MRSQEDVDAFEKLELQIHSSRRELAGLSGKKPNDAINKFKLGHLNTLLEKSNILLGPDIPLDGFTVFDVDEVPTNSDVVFVFAQYTDALHRFRIRHTAFIEGHPFWALAGSEKKLRAPRPIDRKYKE